MRRLLPMCLGWMVTACTDHGESASELAPAIGVERERATPADVPKQELAWLDARELPPLDEDPRVAAAASPPACPPARPWTPSPSAAEPEPYGFFMIESIGAFELIYGHPPMPRPALPSWTEVGRDGCDLEFSNARGQLEWRSSRVGVELWLDRDASGSIDLRRTIGELPNEFVDQAPEACDVRRHQVIRPPEFVERGFRALHDLPLDGELRITPHEQAMAWRLGRRMGIERYEYSVRDTPVRVDGFDADGVWQRSSLFTYDREFAVRHDFDVVEGEAQLVATLVFDRASERLELARTPERIEYRRHVEHEGDWWALLEQRPEGITRRGTFAGQVERIVEADGLVVDLYTDHEGRHWDAPGTGHFVERCGLEPPPQPEWMGCRM